MTRTVWLSWMVLWLAVGCDPDPAGDDDDTAGDDDDTAADDDVGDDDTDPPLTNVPPSPDPPGGLAVDEVPMFVSIGFDDNYFSGLDGSGGTGGMTWATDMLRERTNPDGSPVRASFYMNTVELEWSALNKHAWRAAYDDGHEIGNHTHSHPLASGFAFDDWLDEIETCDDWLSRPYDPDEIDPDPATGVGIPLEDIVGFRAPYLIYNDAAWDALDELEYLYDCSVREGHQPDQDGTDFSWPYTLDGGSPGHDYLVDAEGLEPAGAHPGLWELPIHAVIVPPDERCAEYGVAPGLRDRLHDFNPRLDPADGKINGLDYSLWIDFLMTGAEVEATLMYTFDLRMQGNRAPMMFAGHTPEYASLYDYPLDATLEERQDAIEAFLDHALSHPEVRVVAMRDIVAWMRSPQPL